MKIDFKVSVGGVRIVLKFRSHVRGKSVLNVYCISFNICTNPTESNKTSTKIEMGYESVFACNSAFFENMR